MIVDDDPSSVEFLEELLEESFELKSAFSGEEALELIPGFKPDIILLDIMMPGISGYEVCQKIRSNRPITHVKILLLSAKTELYERLQGYDVGADDYLTKPFNPQELLAKIKIFTRLKYIEEINEFKDNLLTLQNHETNTPLNKILGFAGLLQHSSNLSAEERKYIDYIIEGGNQLLDNSRKISLLCELKKGLEPGKTKVNVEMMINRVLKNLEESAQKKNVGFEVRCNSSDNIIVDEELVNQALSNIIVNAVRFSPENGIVTIQSEKNTVELVIRISDQGGGIKQKPIEDVFTEFSEDDMTHHSKGMGISLAIAKNIVDLHQGKLVAQNNPKKGATFMMTLPA